jgi:iron complex transport system substrate-binding protein
VRFAALVRVVAVVVTLTMSTTTSAAPDAQRAPHWYRPTSTAPSTSTTVSSTSATRIVSLAPVVTETLFALGAGARVKGVTRFCDRPAAAATLPKVGGYTDASLEAILALAPDLVVAMPSMAQRALLDRLRDQGVPVFVVFADTPDETRAMMRALGEVVGAGDAGARLAARQDDTLAAIAARHRVSARTVVVVGTDPLVVAGPGTFADVALRATGAVSAVRDGDPQWPQWSLEGLLARDVALIVVAEGPAGAARVRQLVAPLGARAPAVVVADRAILMRPGPSFVDDALALEALLVTSPPAQP